MSSSADEISTAQEKFALFDHIPVGVMLLRQDFTVLYWNNCLEDWTGLSKQGITGSDIALRYPHLKSPKYSGRLKSIFDGGPPTIFSSQLHNTIVPSVLWDGRQRIQHTVVTAVRSFDDNSFYALFAIQDVTDLTVRISEYREMRDRALEEVSRRLKIEEELRKTQEGLEQRVEERTSELRILNESLKREISERSRAEAELNKVISALNSTVHHMPDGVALLDDECRIVLSNEKGASYLKMLADAGPGDILEEVGGRNIKTMASGSENNVKHEIKSSGESPLMFEIASSPILETGRIKGMVIVLKDVTEEKALHDRIHAQDRLAAVGQLAAGIAHDFNNILTGIIGLSEIMMEESRLQPDDRQMVDTILQNGLRAAHLIRQILDFSRKSISEMNPLDLKPFLGEFAKFIRRTIPENISIRVRSEAPDYCIRADATKIQQVLANLALNARDAMPEGGIITFELGDLQLSAGVKPPLPEMHVGDWVMLKVTDNGTGMTPEVIAHMFEPFYTTKEVGRGTGLGLSQVYGIVKQHNGFIGVEAAVGEGCSFSIYFPATSSARHAAERENLPLEAMGEAETVLVVEDSESICNLIRRKLTKMNFNVLIASNGLDAIRKFEDQLDSIKLVITDMVMPEMGGLEISRILSSKKPELKIIALSGYPLGAENEDLKKAGIVEFIQKPFQVQALAEAVYKALGKR